MRIVFMGTGAFAVPSLEALLDAGHDVAALVTQPDREKGRGQALAAPPTKAARPASAGLPVLQFRRVREPEAQEALRALRPELQVVVAFGQILPRAVIDLAPLGTVNVHGSLLPRYRGAAPIQWAIASGETETGVTTMLIDEGLDTGPAPAAGARSRSDPRRRPRELEPRLARARRRDCCVETVRGLARRHVCRRSRRTTRWPRSRRILRKEDGRRRLVAAGAADRLAGARLLALAGGLHARTRAACSSCCASRPLDAGPDAAARPGPSWPRPPTASSWRAARARRCGSLEVQPESRRAMPAARVGGRRAPASPAPRLG